ncbi:MAG: STAS domain-containing protein [Pseudonocardia sp.]|nr:STAS domain-containing protein [Pseudonocardia sp.]
MRQLPSEAGTGPQASSWHSILIYDDIAGRDAALQRWIGAALRHGYKVVYQLTREQGSPATVAETLHRHGGALGEALGSGQLELVPADRVRTITDGPGELWEIYEPLVHRTPSDRWTGSALLIDADHLSTEMSDRAALHQLADRIGVHVHTRCETVAAGPLLEHTFARGDGELEDGLWWAARWSNRLQVGGEIAADNLSRFTSVLRSAVHGGADVIDLTGLSFCSAAGIRAVVDAGDDAARHGRTLTLDNPRPEIVMLLDLVGVAEHAGLRTTHQPG